MHKDSEILFSCQTFLRLFQLLRLEHHDDMSKSYTKMSKMKGPFDN